jgi:MFS family permease
MQNRWAVAAAGTITMVCLGTVYSWSLFTQPLIAGFGWSTTTTVWAFALAIFFLGVGAVLGGRWQDRAGPRPVVVTGAVLWGLGNVLAGLGTARFGAWWIYLTYGVVGGLGLGLGYITPVAAVTKWFPDRRGLAGGMVVMGFGLGTFFYNNVVKNVPSFRDATTQAKLVVDARARGEVRTLDPAHVSAVMRTFVISGIVFAGVGGLCASFVRNPPPAGADPAARGLASPSPITPAPGTLPASVPAPLPAPTAPGAERSFTPLEAARTPQFYSLWLMLFLNVTAGILVISNAVPIITELTKVAPGRAAGVYGLLAVFNGLGRFFWGAVSDRIGRNLAYVLIYGVQAVIFFTLGHVHSLGAVGALFALVLLCYGGGFGTMPSFTADYFGTRFMGLIYGWILLAWGVAGVVGPIFAAVVKDRTGSFSGALPVVAWMLLAAAILPLITRRPAPHGAREPAAAAA